MASKREVQARRREVIRGLLIANDPPFEDQKELVKRLKEMGIPATQSSVSRDLNELGARRVPGYYELPSWLEEESPFARARSVVLKIVKAGPYQTLVVTQPGAAGFVAEALEASKWEDDIAGTVAGYSSVLILTADKFFQDMVWFRLKHALGLDGEEGKKRREEGPG